MSPDSYPVLRRRLALCQIRLRVRAFCDMTGLGPSAGERFCCALIAGAVPFALSFILAYALRMPAGYAALQGVGAFLLFSLLAVLLIGWEGDESLQQRESAIALLLPTAEATWRQEQEQKTEEIPEALQYAEEVPRSAVRRTPAPRRHEPPYRKTARAEPAPIRQTIIIHTGGRSAGTAAVLELLCGLFLGTFGVGHIYGGNVALGLMAMFGWWLFVTVNALLCFTFIWIFVAAVIVPVAWLFMLLISPLLAATLTTGR